MRFLAGIVLCFSSLLVANPSPYWTDASGKPLAPLKRSLCGADDMIPMASETTDLKQMGTPIGMMTINLGGATGKCTGTMITKDLFLTAAHCHSECANLSVTFGHLANRNEETFACKSIIETGNEASENDYMLVQLEGNPGTVWGWYDVSSRKMKKNDELLMIHHPMGSPMKVSKNCSVYDADSDFVNHRCDTQPGSSGSAVFAPDYANPSQTRVIGVHTLGGCDFTPDSSNSGPAMSHLVTISPTLRSLAKP